jgi:osmotically-inducible protein OsmY
VASKLATSDPEGGAALQSSGALRADRDDLLGRVQKALAASGVFALRDLTVEQVDGVVFLSGVVGSFYHKQMAQETVRVVTGVVEVVNSVRVLSVR